MAHQATSILKNFVLIFLLLQTKTLFLKFFRYWRINLLVILFNFLILTYHACIKKNKKNPSWRSATHSLPHLYNHYSSSWTKSRQHILIQVEFDNSETQIKNQHFYPIFVNKCNKRITNWPNFDPQSCTKYKNRRLMNYKNGGWWVDFLKYLYFVYV